MDRPYDFRQMDEADAREVAGWHYEPPYDFYDSEADPDDLAELLDPERREGAYFSVLDGEELVGFFQFEGEGDAVNVGLGLRPDLTGGGGGGRGGGGKENPPPRGGGAPRSPGGFLGGGGPAPRGGVWGGSSRR